MELLQGYVQDGEHVGIDDVERWHDTHIISFLSEIESEIGVDQLAKVSCCSTLGYVNWTFEAPSVEAPVASKYTPRNAHTGKCVGKLEF